MRLTPCGCVADEHEKVRNFEMNRTGNDVSFLGGSAAPLPPTPLYPSYPQHAKRKPTVPAAQKLTGPESSEAGVPAE